MTRTERLLMRLFGRPQGWMGRLGGRIMAHTNRPFAEWLIGQIAVQPTDRIVDVGFGPGVAIELLAPRVSRGHVAGVDPSPEMLRAAHRRNARTIGAGQVDLRLGSAESLPFGDGSFDKALAINSMQVWSDVPTGLRELRRVLKRGGLVALGFTVHSRQPQAGAIAAMRGAGLEEPKVLTTRRGYCLLAENT